MTDRQKAAINRVLQSGDISMTPEDAAEIMQSGPQQIRDACKAGTAGFPCSVIGSHVKIPVRPFLEFWGVKLNNYETAVGYRETRGGK